MVSRPNPPCLSGFIMCLAVFSSCFFPLSLSLRSTAKLSFLTCNFKFLNNWAESVVGANEFKSTNIKLKANYSLATIANRRWSNIFSCSSRHHGRSNSDIATNTSSTDNSNNNLTASSASSHETAIHNCASAAHDEATHTEIGAISAALSAMYCGLLITQNTQPIEQKHDLDDSAEIRNANIGRNIYLTHFEISWMILSDARFKV